MSASSWPRVVYHPSQHPDALTRQLTEGLDRREIPAKFHYVTNQQARRWLELHQHYSPSRRDDTASDMYQRAFESLAAGHEGESVELVGLGCGGGHKDGMLARALLAADATVGYTACDASPMLVLSAADHVRRAVPNARIRRLVADLVAAEDLGDFWDASDEPRRVRVLSCLGIVPNVSPELLAQRIVSWMRPGDWLVMSANLHVAGDGDHGLDAILPQYDNALTRRWLSTLLDDLGMEGGPSALELSAEGASTPNVPARIRAAIPVPRDRTLSIDGDAYRLTRGDDLTVFYSNRFTADRFESYLEHHGLETRMRDVLPSGEEGVWVCVRNA